MHLVNVVRFSLNYEGGKWGYNVKADPFKAPEVALPLLAMHVIGSYIRWHGLSPAEKSLVTFRDQMANLQSARERDWMALPILSKRLTMHSYDEIENVYRGKVRDQIKIVIDTHNDDPIIVTVFKGLHFALENYETALFNSPKNPDYESIVKSCDQSFRDKTQQFYQRLSGSDLTGASQTVNELVRLHPYEVGTHLAQAELYLQQKNYKKVDVALQQADIYDAREQHLAAKMPDKTIEQGFGFSVDIKQEHIKRAQLLHENVNQTKYHYHLLQYQEVKRSRNLVVCKDY